MKIKISYRDDNCNQKEEIIITKGNIIRDGKMFNYDYQYHSDYERYSKMNHPESIVNTRFVFNGKKAYSYLNYQELFVLNWYRDKYWTQKTENVVKIITPILSAVAGWFAHKYFGC